MKFMMFIKHQEASRDLKIPKALNDAMGEFVTRSFASGVLKDTNGLQPTSKLSAENSKLFVRELPDEEL